MSRSTTKEQLVKVDTVCSSQVLDQQLYAGTHHANFTNVEQSLSRHKTEFAELTIKDSLVNSCRLIDMIFVLEFETFMCVTNN